MAVAATFLVSIASSEEVETKPYGGKPAAIPGKIEAEHWDLGATQVAYSDIDQQNRGADYREKTQVDIEKRDDASNGYGVGWTKKGEWLIYSVDVKQSGVYSLSIPVASNKQGGEFHLEIAGKDVSGPISVPDTGGWDKLKEITHDEIQLKAGRQRIKVVMDEEGASKSIGDIDCFVFKLK
ncbi:MAG: carbohydrate-binding protein [Rubripirellula sp.]